MVGFCLQTDTASNNIKISMHKVFIAVLLVIEDNNNNKKAK